MRPVRSIFFDKTPSDNWPVAWHQDFTISVKEKHETPHYGPWSEKDGVIHVQAPEFLLANMITIRLHLEPTQASNGALKVIPKSHLQGKRSLSDVPEDEKQTSRSCECQAGQLLLMSPLIFHASNR